MCPLGQPWHTGVKGVARRADGTVVIFHRRRLRPLAGVVAVLALAGPAASASAADRTPDSRVTPAARAVDPAVLGTQVTQARAQALAAQAAVAQLTTSVRQAQAAYGQAVAAVGTQAFVTWTAVEHARELQQTLAHAAEQHVGTARSLYMGGGPQGLASSLLDADDPADLAGRLVLMRRLMDRSSQIEAQAQVAAQRAQQAAEAADAAGSQAVVTVDLVGDRAAQVDALLAAAQHQLDALTARSRSLAQARQAATALAAARAAARAQQLLVRQSVPAVTPPTDYLALYRAAALSCPGMAWQLLAAVGQVESGHGRNVGPSSAGAIGPMQFMPRTFASYAVDGDRDGRLDPWAPADSIFTAAHYLCSSGASSPAGYQRALLTYNHAQWYVDLVLAAMAGY